MASGFRRVVNGRIDIGAFESHLTPTPTPTATATAGYRNSDFNAYCYCYCHRDGYAYGDSYSNIDSNTDTHADPKPDTSLCCAGSATDQFRWVERVQRSTRGCSSEVRSNAERCADMRHASRDDRCVSDKHRR